MGIHLAAVVASLIEIINRLKGAATKMLPIINRSNRLPIRGLG
jgi:hypothetical protein